MPLHSLNDYDMILRLALSFAAGAIIGFERASHHQVAGLRTHILISMGSCMLSMLSIWVPQHYAGPSMGSDTTRIAASIIPGIGFLGAGAIIKLGNNVRGLTTAASLFFISSVGIGIGAGMYFSSGVAVFIGFITLFLLAKFERRIFPLLQYKYLEITYRDSNPDVEQALNILRESGIHIQSEDLKQSETKKRSKLIILAGITSAVDINEIAKAVKALHKVQKVEIKERY
jgi:putative Mg2+ transporter-C (MgtC) family protein